MRFLVMKPNAASRPRLNTIAPMPSDDPRQRSGCFPAEPYPLCGQDQHSNDNGIRDVLGTQFSTWTENLTLKSGTGMGSGQTQIDFHKLAFDAFMILSTMLDVTARFSAPASFFEISSTLCPPSVPSQLQ